MHRIRLKFASGRLPYSFIKTHHNDLVTSINEIGDFDFKSIIVFRNARKNTFNNGLGSDKNATFLDERESGALSPNNIRMPERHNSANIPCGKICIALF